MVSPSKLASVARLWLLALALSLLLVAAGHHWPDTPAPTPPLVWSLLLLPSAGLGFWILRHWRLPLTGNVGGDGGESSDCAHGER